MHFQVSNIHEQERNHNEMYIVATVVKQKWSIQEATSNCLDLYSLRNVMQMIMLIHIIHILKSNFSYSLHVKYHSQNQSYPVTQSLNYRIDALQKRNRNKDAFDHYSIR